MATAPTGVVPSALDAWRSDGQSRGPVMGRLTPCLACIWPWVPRRKALGLSPAHRPDRGRTAAIRHSKGGDPGQLARVVRPAPGRSPSISDLWGSEMDGLLGPEVGAQVAWRAGPPIRGRSGQLSGKSQAVTVKGVNRELGVWRQPHGRGDGVKTVAESRAPDRPKRLTPSGQRT
jgi:hypothetical protein